MIITTCLIAWILGSVGGARVSVAARAPPHATATTAVRAPTAPIAADLTARLRATDHRTADECRACAGWACPRRVVCIGSQRCVGRLCSSSSSSPLSGSPRRVRWRAESDGDTGDRPGRGHDDRDDDHRDGPTTSESTATETTSESTTTETGATPPKGDPVAGKSIFLGASGCTGCHTLADAGSSGTVGPNLDDAKPSFDLAYDRVTNGQGGMPSFGTSLTDQQRADVAAYVSSVAGK